MDLSAIGSAIGDTLKQTLSAAVTQYGPGTVLLVFAVWWLWRQQGKLWRERLEDKDKEIRRLVEERDKYQDMFLKKRLSTDTQKKNNKEPMIPREKKQ